MIYDLNTSVDLRWLFDHRCYIHLRWSCFFLTESPVTMRIRHYFASLAPPADQLPNDEEDAPRKKEVASHVYDLFSQHALKFSWLLFWGTLHCFVRLLWQWNTKGEGESRDTREDVANVSEETAEEHWQETCWPSWVWPGGAIITRMARL